MISVYDSGIDYYSLVLSADTGGEADVYASFVPPAGSVLEIACGTGRLTLLFAGRGLTVTGLDNSQPKPPKPKPPKIPHAHDSSSATYASLP